MLDHRGPFLVAPSPVAPQILGCLHFLSDQGLDFPGRRLAI